MDAAYSAMVRSLENFPEPATFRMALCAQPSRSAYRLDQTLVRFQVGFHLCQMHVWVAERQKRVVQWFQIAVSWLLKAPGVVISSIAAASGSFEVPAWLTHPALGQLLRGQAEREAVLSPVCSAISMVALSRVPRVNALFIMNFMLLVPLAS